MPSERHDLHRVRFIFSKEAVADAIEGYIANCTTLDCVPESCSFWGVTLLPDGRYEFTFGEISGPDVGSDERPADPVS